jgi:hypothetical protein
MTVMSVFRRLLRESLERGGARVDNRSDGASKGVQASLDMTGMNMDLDAIDAHAVAEAMLARGFAELLAPEAFDDGPVLESPSRPLQRVLEPRQRTT